MSQDRKSRYNDAQSVLQSVPGLDTSTPPEYVHPYRLRETAAAIDRIVAQHPGSQVMISVTGAPMTMGITGYEAAKALNSPAFSLNMIGGELIDLTMPDEPESMRIRLTVEQYLSFFRREPRPRFNPDQLSIGFDEAIQVARYLALNIPASTEVLEVIRTEGQGKGKRTRFARNQQPTQNQWEVRQYLVDVGLLACVQWNSGTRFTLRSDGDFEFLKGTWLELYAWDEARKQ
ncbi:MAG TPA: DUF1887 family protein, partial [Anaerolineae bacterium]|nr:DUF1887 family protein [Anaerolineae bacterium]